MPGGARAVPPPHRGTGERAYDGMMPATPTGLNVTRIGLLYILMGMAVATVLSRVPAMRNDFGLATDALGLLLFGFALGAMVGLLAAPATLGRLGIRRTIGAGLLISVSGLVLLGVSATLWQAPVPGFLGLVLANAGLGLIDVAMNVAGAALERRAGRSLLPLLHAGYSLGAALGALAGTGVIALGGSVLVHVLGFAAVLGIGGALGRSGLEHDAPGGRRRREAAAAPTAGEAEHERPVRWAAWRALADPRILLIGLTMLGFNFGEGSAADWMALGAIDGHGLDEATAAAVFTVFMWSMFFARLGGGPLVDRVGRAPALRWGAVIAVAGVLLFILTPAPWALFVAAVLWGVGCALGFPVTMSAAGDDPEHAAARVSAVAVAGYTALLAGPPLLGLLGHAIGVLPSLLVTAGLLVLAGCTAGATRERPELAG